MEAFFSVIMPTYNQASFIRRAILSLYKQTYSNWELIIINDGCTDETEIFISDFLEDDRVTYIKNEVNQGLGYALNQGLEVAKYEYIAYLPSDDYYYENHLESISKKFAEGENVVLIYTGLKYDSPDTLYYTADTESKGVKKVIAFNWCKQHIVKQMTNGPKEKSGLLKICFRCFGTS